MSIYTKPIRSDELYHHGILGMHWGIRRFQPYPKGYKGSGKEIGEAKRKTNSTSHRQRLKEEIKSLSNEELQKRINRMRLEDSYEQLMNIRLKEALKSSSNKTAAKKYIIKKMSWAGDKFVTSLMALGIGYLSKEAYKKLSREVKIARLASAIATTNPKKP